ERADGGTEHMGGSFGAALWNERRAGKSQQFAVACGDCGAGKCEPEDKVLNYRACAGNAEPGKAAPENLEERKNGHPQQRSRAEDIFPGRDYASLTFAAGRHRAL